MKKYSTFAIVFFVQVTIFFGLYKWFTANENHTDKNITTVTKANANTLPKTNPPVNTTQNISTPVHSEIKSNMDGINIGNPLVYKDAIWGNLSILPLSKQAVGGILVDLKTRKVLWAKNSRKTLPIASMSKMMTILLTLEAIQKHKIGLDTVIDVTNEAYKIGGSKVYLDPKEEFTLYELLKAVMIRSANDCAYLIGQNLGDGNIDNFIKAMNQRAKELNMRNTHFTNPDGLPEKKSMDDNKSSPEDLVLLAEQILQYPEELKLAVTPQAYFREKTKKQMVLTNTNHLVRDKFPGITGLKTGYTKRAGYCLTATCKRDEKYLVAVIMGFQTGKDRDIFAKQLLDWGFSDGKYTPKYSTQKHTKHKTAKNIRKSKTA